MLFIPFWNENAPRFAQEAFSLFYYLFPTARHGEPISHETGQSKTKTVSFPEHMLLVQFSG